MIKTENGHTDVLMESPETLIKDTLDVITTFIQISKELQISDEKIEKSLVGMIATGFEREATKTSCIVIDEEEEK